MELERVAVAIRERPPAEAVDLGFALTRARWPSIGVYLGVVLVPAAGLAFVLWSVHPLAAFAAFWWLKPLYDRAVLYVASRALFGESPRLPGAARELCAMLRLGLFGDLTFRRFSPWRSYSMPVRILEGLARGQLSRRLGQIGKAHRGTAVALTATVVLFQLGLWCGLVLLLMLLSLRSGAPDPLTAFFSAQTPLARPLGYWCFVASTLLTEGFYVCAGFCLYVNRRVGLEGWDLELVLRRLARRLSGAPGGARTVGIPARPSGQIGEVGPAPSTRPTFRIGVILVGLSLFFLLGSPTADAQVRSADGPSREQIREAADEVLQGEDFGLWRERTVWRPIWSRQSGDPCRSGGGGEAPDGILEWLAWTAPFLLGAAVLGAIVYAAVIRVRPAARRRTAHGAESGRRLPAAALADGEGLPLPRDWARAARQAWAEDKQERALSYIYRGALASAQARQGTDISSGATEREAVAWARSRLTGDTNRTLLRLLQEVVALWLHLAYGRRPVSADRFAEVAALADEVAEGDS